MRDPRERFEPWLDKRQQKGIKVAMARFDAGGDRFLLEDGPGIGKTMQMIAVAWALSKGRQGPALLAVPTPTIAKQVSKDIEESGVSTKRVVVRLHAEMDKLLHGGRFAAVVADEAHPLVGSSGELPHFDVPTMFATGSAFDSPRTAVAFAAWITGETIEDAASALRIQFDGGGDGWLRKCEPTEGHCWRDVGSAIGNFTKWLHSVGLSIRRDMDFHGSAELEIVPGARDRCRETLCVLAARELYAGRKAVVYSPPGESASVAAELDEHGMASGTIADAKAFKRGSIDAIVLERGRENEGVRLHDTNGDAPRSVIVDEIPGALDLIQIQHRVSRRKSASESVMRVIFDPASKRDVLQARALAMQSEFLRDCNRNAPALADHVKAVLSEIGVDLGSRGSRVAA